MLPGLDIAAPLLSGGAGGLSLASSAKSGGDPFATLKSPKLFNIGGGLSSGDIVLIGGLALLGLYIMKKVK